MLAGTVAPVLLLVTVIAKPPVGAALLSVAVHAEVPGALTVVGEQTRLLKTAGVCVMVIAPPVPDEGIEFAVAPVATMLVTPIGMLALVDPAEIVNVAVASVPVGIVDVPPNRMHIVDPAPEQSTLFPAAVAAGLATTVTLVTSEGYVKVHWRPVGDALLAVMDTPRATEDPGVALPEPTDRVTCCATAGITATKHKIKASKGPFPRRRFRNDAMLRIWTSSTAFAPQRAGTLA
jgi:hypothetical protein